MFRHLRAVLVSFTLLTSITGLAYPALVTAAASVVFPDKASGSLVRRDGKVVGSSLIGQSFESARYFWGRPSGTSPAAYDASASTGTNQGPMNPALAEAVRARVAKLREADPDAGSTPVPVDLVTASGSGLDPHISPAAAQYQVRRVARARDLPEASVRRLVDAHTEGRVLGVIGEPRVNVLALNLALDALPADAGGR